MSFDESPEYFEISARDWSLFAVSKEITGQVSSVTEVVHDVFEVGCVLQSEGMANLMHAGEIDDRVPEKTVPRGAGCDTARPCC